MEQMNKIFISYSREDEAQAAFVQQALTRAGFEVWFDKNNLRPGDDWNAQIHSAIRDCRFFLALLSSNSLGKRGYVQKEVKLALDVLDEFPPDEIFIVPVRLDNCNPQHERLRMLNWVNMFPDTEPGLTRIVEFFENELVIKGEVAELERDYGDEAQKSQVFESRTGSDENS